jgi:hypothetical protein
VIGDVGASSVEEIDFAPAAAGLGAGANFGWPACEGFSGTCPGTTTPVFAYADSDPCNAVIGGYVYRGSRAPELSGRYLYTDLCHPELRSLSLATPLATGDRSEGVTLPSSPFSFGEDANCDLYIAAGSGAVQRIVGSTASAAPACPSSPSTSTPVRKRKCKKRQLKIGPVRIAPVSRAAEATKKRCKKRGKKR